MFACAQPSGVGREQWLRFGPRREETKTKQKGGGTMVSAIYKVGMRHEKRVPDFLCVSACNGLDWAQVGSIGKGRDRRWERWERGKG